MGRQRLINTSAALVSTKLDIDSSKKLSSPGHNKLQVIGVRWLVSGAVVGIELGPGNGAMGNSS